MRSRLLAIIYTYLVTLELDQVPCLTEALAPWYEEL